MRVFVLVDKMKTPPAQVAEGQGDQAPALAEVGAGYSNNTQLAHRHWQGLPLLWQPLNCSGSIQVYQGMHGWC